MDYPPAGVTALGRLPLADKVEEMGRAELLVVPSLKGESFGIVLVEGLAAGMPVVASDIPAYRSVLHQGDVGRLTPPGDPFHLADELVALLGDAAARSRLVGKGLGAVRRYDWSAVADRVVEVYEDAAARWSFAALGQPASSRQRGSTPRSPRRR
jgi:phosphatidylinositol alpha-mannosyltransferase